MNQQPNTVVPIHVRVRELAALLFAMFFPSLMAWLYFMVLPRSSSGGEQNPALQIAFGAGKFIQFTFPLLYVALFDRGALRFTRPTPRGMPIALAFGLTVGLVTMSLYFFGLKGTPLFEATSEKIHRYLTQLALPSVEGFLVMAVFVCLVHSLWEEYYWRWFVFGRLRSFVPWQAAAVLSGLAFMSHHVIVLMFYLPGYFWAGVVPFSLCVAAGGVIWAWIYHRYESLYATWASHCIIDVAIMAVGFDLLRPYLH